MSYRDLLVHVDNSDACPARVAAAVSLAERFESRLHGYCIIPPDNLSVYGEGAIAADLVEPIFRRIEKDLEAAESNFRSAVSESPVEYRCTIAKGLPAQLLPKAACEVDLTIVGQPDETDPNSTSARVADSVAFGAGSGVLVLPKAGTFKTFGQRAIVAWDGSREAQRAVNESLPLLRGAERVEVISILTGKFAGGDTSEPARRVCERLVEIGINAHAHYVSAPDEAAGDTVLARCRSEHADLLVLGAYGHSRLREFLLGGVTRTILREHSIPVLIAH